MAHADVLDGLLTKTLAAFMAEGLFDADEIVVDGTKIKASAGKSSYKRALRLDEAEAVAKGRVVALKAEVDADPAASSKRTQAARARGLRQTQERIEKARAKLVEIEAEKAKRSKRSPKEVAEQKEARASLTDPEARQMRCADGAVRASYNVQIAATTDHGFVTAIMTTDRRTRNLDIPGSSFGRQARRLSGLYATLARKASSAAWTASGVPTCIQTPSSRRPNSRSCSLARSNIFVSENSPDGASANKEGDMIAAPA